MLSHRLRRWPNIETALSECPVFAGLALPWDASLTKSYVSEEPAGKSPEVRIVNRTAGNQAKKHTQRGSSSTGHPPPPPEWKEQVGFNPTPMKGTGNQSCEETGTL